MHDNIEQQKQYQFRKKNEYIKKEKKVNETSHNNDIVNKIGRANDDTNLDKES